MNKLRDDARERNTKATQQPKVGASAGPGGFVPVHGCLLAKPIPVQHVTMCWM